MITIFQWGLQGEMGLRLFWEGVQFLHKSKLESEIFNEKKKFVNKNVFLCQFNLITFEKCDGD